MKAKQTSYEIEVLKTISWQDIPMWLVIELSFHYTTAIFANSNQNSFNKQKSDCLCMKIFYCGLIE